MATNATENPEHPDPPIKSYRGFERSNRQSNNWLEMCQLLLTIIVIAIFVITFLVQAFQIPSGSMEDTLLVGDYLLVDKFSFSPEGPWPHVLPYRAIRRGDIIVFRWPVHPDQHVVKRVIGLPGDRIHLVNGKVFVNGTLIDDAFAVRKLMNHDPFRDDFPARHGSTANVNPSWLKDLPSFTRNNELLVPEDCYFVMGDNRDESSDSRYWGFVPRENVVGKPLVIYFSMRRFDEERFLSSTAASGKIERFADHMLRLPSLARWNRTLRFIK